MLLQIENDFVDVLFVAVFSPRRYISGHWAFMFISLVFFFFHFYCCYRFICCVWLLLFTCVRMFRAQLNRTWLNRTRHHSADIIRFCIQRFALLKRKCWKLPCTAREVQSPFDALQIHSEGMCVCVFVMCDNVSTEFDVRELEGKVEALLWRYCKIWYLVWQ